MQLGDRYHGWHDPARLTLGRHSYGQPVALTYGTTDDGRVAIGGFCSIAADVVFLLDGEHRHDFITTSPLVDMGLGLPEGINAGKGPIVVEDDVWIGRGACVLSGVHIGTGAVVAAYAVVTKDVRPYAIVGGNPAREIRRRFPDEQCELLLRSRWWDWPDPRIRAAVSDLWSADIAAFIDRWAPYARDPWPRIEALAFADELAAHPELLRSWVAVASTDSHRQARLLVHPGDAAPEAVHGLITAAMAAIGIGADTELEIEAFAVPLGPPAESELAQRCTWALTRAALSEPFDCLIPLDLPV